MADVSHSTTLLGTGVLGSEASGFQNRLSSLKAFLLGEPSVGAMTVAIQKEPLPVRYCYCCNCPWWPLVWDRDYISEKTDDG